MHTAVTASWNILFQEVKAQIAVYQEKHHSHGCGNGPFFTLWCGTPVISQSYEKLDHFPSSSPKGRKDPERVQPQPSMALKTVVLSWCLWNGHVVMVMMSLDCSECVRPSECGQLWALATHRAFWSNNSCESHSLTSSWWNWLKKELFPQILEGQLVTQYGFGTTIVNMLNTADVIFFEYWTSLPVFTVSH